MPSVIYYRYKFNVNDILIAPDFGAIRKRHLITICYDLLPNFDMIFDIAPIYVCVHFTLYYLHAYDSTALSVKALSWVQPHQELLQKRWTKPYMLF